MTNYIKYYLTAYNFVALVFWMLFMVAFFGAGCNLRYQCLLLLNIAQGLAVLEIFHAALKWVKSPLISTIAQVGSRILVLVLINIFAKEEMHIITKVGIGIVAFAWGVTEMVRYGHYFMSIINKENSWLIWMRYSFFILLYPLGITGEWFIISTPIIQEGISLNFYNAMGAVLAVSYLYYFPVLYKYMWKQRKAKLPQS